MRNVHIKGLSDEKWVDIINGVDLDVLGAFHLVHSTDGSAHYST